MKRSKLIHGVRHFVELLAFLTLRCSAQQQQDPSTMNGGSIMAMAGRQCLAVAVDKRFASNGLLVQVAPRSILHVPDTLTMVVFTGLESDVHALKGALSTEISRKYSRGLGFNAPKGLSTKSMASLTSHVLYNRKKSPYYVTPLVVGLDPTPRRRSLQRNSDDDSDPTTELSAGTFDFESYLCGMDCIGARSESRSFVCSGAAKQSLYGTCEALWRPDMNPDELLAVCSKAFFSALERDCLSGYGAIVYLITPDGIEEFDIMGRTD
jgi:20S proteasome subunit beta 3